jgi:RES domain-containing protein
MVKKNQPDALERSAWVFHDPLESTRTSFFDEEHTARWHNTGKVMVYNSEHPALAALEVANHWRKYASLNGYHLYSASFEDTHIQHAPFDLEQGSPSLETSRSFGDDWIAAQTSLALRVPSVVAPHSWNYLLNPAHPEFYGQVQLETHGLFQYDERIQELVAQAQGQSTD